MEKRTNLSPEGRSLRHLGGLSKERSVESHAIKVPEISLPNGGGAIKGVDEKFSVNPATGSFSLALPLPFSPARGLTPNHTLAYSSGAGNSPFGLGWNLDLSAISRKTSAGLPQYDDTPGGDTYLLSDAEDLVPAFRKNPDGGFQKDVEGHYIFDERTSGDGLHRVQAYLPRVEGLFARIERWTHTETGRIRWRVITRENITSLYGWTDQAVIADPRDPIRIFRWLPELVFDDRGNCTRYFYKKEDGSGFDPDLAHNRNRRQNGQITYANTYPSRILYGNRTPYDGFGSPFPEVDDFVFSTVFDYGEYDLEAPEQPVASWHFRSDAFSDYKAGFEIRTSRRCRRVLLFHHFSGPGEYAGLVRSLDFQYESSAGEDFTFLISATSRGYIRQDEGAYSTKAYPPMEFSYQAHAWNREVRAVSAEELPHLPAGLEAPRYAFTDLYQEGLAGLLSEQAGTWYYQRNLGGASFAPAQPVSPKPSFKGLHTAVVLADLEADGGRQLVSRQAAYPGFFELDDARQWHGFRPFEQFPNIDFEDPQVRLLDLTGDGRPDVVLTEEEAITWYPSEGRSGYAPRRKAPKFHSEEEGPKLVFADGMQTIFLADMSGDGMTDLVRIRNGEVCYWPNLGYGRFGAKVAMDAAPRFDHPDQFHPAFLRLADIDGSGVTDIVYLGKNAFTCWKNLSGNRFANDPIVIPTFPEVHDRVKVSVVDLLGNGTACIVWSSPLVKDRQAPLRYIDLMNSRKPHLLVGYRNNLGKEVSLEYTPSTKFYLDDLAAGRPWATKLHFPVQCVSRQQTVDRVSGYRFVQEFAFHHGCYDHVEREFRGFGMTERTDAEAVEHWEKQNGNTLQDAELQQEPIVYRIWHHTGAFAEQDRILKAYEEDFWYRERERQGFPTTQKERASAEPELIVAPELGLALAEAGGYETRRQAMRGCKGMKLRTEVFARDAARHGNTEEARRRALTPYKVSLQTGVVELLQPQGQNRHAVFVVKNRDTLTYHYERTADNPRIAHSLNVALDAYGNILQSAAVVYPRPVPDLDLPEPVRRAQDERIVLFKDNRFTNDAVGEDTYRLRLPAETRTFQLKGVEKSGEFYTPTDFTDILSDDRSDAVPYQQFEQPPNPGRAQRRLVEHVCSLYYRDDLGEALPLYQMASLGLSFESYRLAYSPDLLTDIFGTRLDAAALAEGGFVALPGHSGQWMPSGRAIYRGEGESPAAAQTRFFTPVAYLDPYGATTEVSYLGGYFMHLEETADPFGNLSRVEQFNYRVLAPRRVRDVNGNLSEALHDELGLVKAIALFGKGSEADELTGLAETTDPQEHTAIQDFFQAPDSAQLTARGNDLLQRATTRFVHDLDTDLANGKPAVVATIEREEHFSTDPAAAVQLSFEYSNGHGELVLRKRQAAPGLAKQVTVHPDLSITVQEVDTAAGNPAQLRWLGNGRVVKNNKGNAVKDYEPYFSVTHRYEGYPELVENGVTPLMYYDAAGRLVETRMPDGSLSRIEFDTWRQVVYDSNDLLLDPGSTWFAPRSNRLIDTELQAAGKDPLKEQQAADRSVAHADTPSVLHFDSMGRPILTVEHQKDPDSSADQFFATHVALDAEGNLRRVTDARGNLVMQHKFDMLSNQVFQDSMDGGRRWLFLNVAGAPLRNWDERGHEFRYAYDALQRLTTSTVLGGDGPSALNHVFGLIRYGEDLLLPDASNRAALQAQNLLGQPVEQYDTGGRIEFPAYDFKGNAPVVTRRLFQHYKEVPDWAGANPDAGLEPEAFSFTTETDALGRITRQTQPDGSVIIPTYDASGQLQTQAVQQPGGAAPTEYIKRITYNARGQREMIHYGNDVRTRHYYDAHTFRLIRLESKTQGGDPLQDLRYTYDAMGNITHLEDHCVPVVFFNNQKVTGLSEFTYDPLYQLVRATGRENNAALAFGASDNWNDAGFRHLMQPGDPMAIRNYVQTYRYDAVGNILQVKHVATGNNWTRNYTYASANNRLLSTHLGDDPGPRDFTAYAHHAEHGFMTAMPHLEDLGWNFKEELVRSIRQRVDPANGSPETTYYQYDGQGRRLRKVTEHAAADGQTPGRKEERIYVAGYELYRRFSGANAGLERVSLSLMDDGHRFAMIETRNAVDDGTEAQLVRYLLHDHLGSASLELDDAARAITYEEYHPYGTTAYQARNATIRAAAKRYRFTGKERDEETGLAYHGARYYLPWLGRWLSCDPSGISDSVNRYEYARGSPVMFHDPGGLSSCGVAKEEKEEKAEDKEGKEKKKKGKDAKKEETESEDNESEGFFDKIKGAISTFFGWVGQGIIAAGRWIAEQVGKAWEWVKEAASAAWNWIKETATEAWNWIKGALETAWDWTTNALGSAWNWIKEAAADAWNWLKQAAADAWEWIKGAAVDVWNWVLAPLVRTATNALVGALPGILTGNLGAAIAGGIAGGVTGAVHGWAMAYAGSYDWGNGRSWLYFLADNTWSLPNSVIGSLFATANIFWNPIDKGYSENTGQLFFEKNWFAGYDTTLPGNVTVGKVVPIHEMIHTMQARIFGPFYLAFQLVWYGFWLAMFPFGGPVWAITGYNYLKCIAYNNNPFEIWAYSVEGHTHC